MEKLMPIEPGCKCLFMGSQETREVVAVEFVGVPQKQHRVINGVAVIHTFDHYTRWWRLDREVKKRSPVMGNYYSDLVGESYLLRIDGHTPSVQTEEKATGLIY